jgi:hypothetical protein
MKFRFSFGALRSYHEVDRCVRVPAMSHLHLLYRNKPKYYAIGKLLVLLPNQPRVLGRLGVDGNWLNHQTTETLRPPTHLAATS